MRGTEGVHDGTESRTTSLRQWARVGLLLLGTFTVVTSEMVLIGLLTPVADALQVGSAVVGSGVAVTGLVIAVAAPLVPRVIGRVDRRVVVATALIVLAAGNMLAAIAGDVTQFFASRLILGIGIAGVWSLAGVVATRLVAPREGALAVTIAVSGVAAASVIGIPVGTAAGAAFGWRSVYAALAIIAVVVGVLVLAAYPRLPRVASRVTTTGDSSRGIGRTAGLVLGFAFIIVLVSAQFAVYTYIRPLLENTAGIDAAGIALVLFGYGIAGLISNFVAGALAAKRPRRTVLTIAWSVLAVLVVLFIAGTLPEVAVPVVIAWGLGYGGLSVAGQIWLTRAAPGREEHVTALYVGVFNAAVAAGSFLGAVFLDVGGEGGLLIGAALLAASAVVLGFFGPDPRQHATRQVTAPS